MCGILGYSSLSGKIPEKEQVTEMFSLLESRGRDACGYAFIKDGNLVVQKDAVRSSVFVQSKAWKDLELPPVLIAHTRMKTQGSEKNNANNHPLYNKQGLCICHNGVICNDSLIFGKQKRDGEVDSEAILAVLVSKEKGDKIKQVFDRLEGSFVFALINKNEPERLTLVKKDNPLEIYLDTENEILYFCSQRDIMQEALGIKATSRFGFNLGEGPYHHYSMENNYALIINKEGVESYKRYTPKRDDWRFGGFGRSYLQESGDEYTVECPWCSEITLYYPGKLYNHCENCGQPLNEEDLYV